jgi:hypothetical protein
MDNEYAEYFQISFFLICERLKGKKSFWYPYLTCLPSRVDNFFTIYETETISKNST